MPRHVSVYKVVPTAALNFPWKFIPKSFGDFAYYTKAKA
jgi:hypothetical protein